MLYVLVSSGDKYELIEVETNVKYKAIEEVSKLGYDYVYSCYKYEEVITALYAPTNLQRVSIPQQRYRKYLQSIERRIIEIFKDKMILCYETDTMLTVEMPLKQLWLRVSKLYPGEISEDGGLLIRKIL